MGSKRKDRKGEERLLRARRAAKELRQGLYEGPSMADRVDEILYGARRAGKPGRPRFRSRG